MAIEITMPKLSDTMEEGTVLQWKVKEGDRIEEGDVIAEVETDKAAMEMEAFDSGVVSALKVEEGETVSVGTVIAVLEADGDEDKQAKKEGKKERKAQREKKEKEEGEEEEEEAEEEERPQEQEEAAEEPEEEEEEEEEKEEKEEEEGERKERKRGREKSAGSAEWTDRGEEAQKTEPSARKKAETLDLVASPAARALAREKGIDLSRVRGTGPGGRIIVSDVEKARKEGGAKAEGKPGAGQRRKERSVKIRRIVAGKMVESWKNIPHFYVTVCVDMTEVIRIRKELDVTINDLIITATARTLQEHPWVNSRWVDGEPSEQKQINIALAVATERGLYNPVVRGCEGLSLRQISARAHELGEKAHAGRLSGEDMENGTFTISNMGMLGVESFSAIITPPQAAVLAVGTVKGETVVDEQGHPAVAPQVRLTLSADHRILDGADAADFLATLKSYLEAPVMLTDNHSGKERT